MSDLGVPSPAPEPAPSDRIWLARIVLGLVGLGFAGWGLLSLVTHVPPASYVPILRWGVAGIVVHDGFLAPVGVVTGWLVMRHLRPRVRPIARAALLAVAAVGLLLAAYLGGRRHPQNPTVEATDPLLAVVVAGVALLVGMVAAAVLSRAVERRRVPT